MNKNNSIKVLAVIIAIVGWFMINLLKEHTTVINFPIRIVNIPDNIHLFENESIRLPVIIQGKGINILHFYFTTPTIDYNGFDIVMGDNLLDLNRVESSLPNYKGLDISLLPIENTLLVTTDRILQKRVPVYFDFFSERDREILIENHYGFDDHFVTLLGPSVEIQKIDNVLTERVSADILKTNRRNIRLKSINDFVAIIPSFIELKQITETISTRTISFIPIDFNELNISIFPKRVSIILEGKQDSLNVITPDDIHAYVLDHEINNLMELNIYFQVPDFVKIVDFTPTKVNVIFNQNQ